MTAEPRLPLLRGILDELYRPAGHRLGIAVAGDCPDGDTATVAAVLADHGHTSERRLAHLRPRPDEANARPDDLAGFLARYGHEYGVAWLTSPAGDAATAIPAISAAARAQGCAIGWDLTATPTDDPAALLHGATVDFALWRAPGDPDDHARAHPPTR
jgi:kynureninase